MDGQLIVISAEEAVEIYVNEIEIKDIESAFKINFSIFSSKFFNFKTHSKTFYKEKTYGQNLYKGKNIIIFDINHI